MPARCTTPPRRAQDPSQPTTARLILTPEARPGRFTARLESGEVIVADTRQPLVEGAREIAAKGFAAGLLLTLRHVGKGYDSFKPAPVGELAKVTYTEGETTPLRRQAWKPRQMPIAAVTGAQKSGFATGREESFTLGQNRPAAAPVMTSANVATGHLDEVATGHLDEVAVGQLDERLGG